VLVAIFLNNHHGLGGAQNEGTELLLLTLSHVLFDAELA
jgi:hypothetical protein